MAEIAVVSVVQILKNYSSSESSSSDEEYESLRKKKHVKHPRIKNYAQTIVSRYMDYEFKSRFRLNIIFFTLLISFLNIQKRFLITLIEAQINILKMYLFYHLYDFIKLFFIYLLSFIILYFFRIYFKTLKTIWMNSDVHNAHADPSP